MAQAHLKIFEGAARSGEVHPKVIREAGWAGDNVLPLPGSPKSGEPCICGEGRVGCPVPGSQAVAGNAHIPDDCCTCNETTKCLQ